MSVFLTSYRSVLGALHLSPVVPVAAWIIVNPFDCSSDAKDTITTAKVIYHPLHTDM